MSHLKLQLFQLLRREQHGWGAAGLYWTSSEGVVDLGAGSSGTGDVASMRAGLRMIGRDMGGTPTCRGEARGCRMRGDWPKGEGPWTGEVVNGTGMGGIKGGAGDDRPDPGTRNERTQWFSLCSTSVISVICLNMRPTQSHLEQFSVFLAVFWACMLWPRDECADPQLQKLTTVLNVSDGNDLIWPMNLWWAVTTTSLRLIYTWHWVTTSMNTADLQTATFLTTWIRDGQLIKVQLITSTWLLITHLQKQQGFPSGFTHYY